MAQVRRRYEAEVLLRGERVAVFPWFQNATEPSGEPFVFGTEPTIADGPDAAWIGATVRAALDTSTAEVEPPADPIKPFNKARTKAFGVTSLKALRTGLVTVAVRVTGDLVDVTPFEGSGTPGQTIQLTLPASDDELGSTILGAAATLR